MSKNTPEMDVKIYIPKEEGPLLARASVTLGGCFAIRDINIREGKNGPFVSMPSRKYKDEYHDVCFPCTKEFKREFDQNILDAYQQKLSEIQGHSQSMADMMNMYG